MHDERRQLQRLFKTISVCVLLAGSLAYTIGYQDGVMPRLQARRSGDPARGHPCGEE